MRSLGGFLANAGDRIQLNILEFSDNIEAATGVVKRFDDDGGGIAAQWKPAQLESKEGGQFELTKAHGFSVIIVPVVHGDGTVKIRLQISNGVDTTDTVAINTDEPLGYRIVIK